MRKSMFLLLMFVALLFSLTIVPAYAAPTEEQINEAVERGLEWLAANQAADGSWNTNYRLGSTAAAVLAFEEEGYFPGSGTLHANVVEKGLDYIFGRAFIQTPLPAQTAGDPDSDGDDMGVYFSGNSVPSYETGICAMAVVASSTPDRVVTTGACIGWTYREVMEDVVDWFAFAQSDPGSSGRGGWRYGAYNNTSGSSDNSAAQWPVLGMIAAERWDIYAPDWVKDELNFWVDYIQNDDGCSGYTDPYYIPNVAKTGALLVEMYWLGDSEESERVQKAIECINSRWEQAPSTHDGNKGQPYAMFAAYKGLAFMGAEISSVPGGDWWGDYAQFLVDTQIQVGDDQGYWQPGSGSWSDYNDYITTGWYIPILQGTIFPVQVNVSVPPCACENAGYNVEITYSAKRFQVDGTLEIYRDGVLINTETVEDFQGSATIDVSSDPGAPGSTPGEHTWEAVFDVTVSRGIGEYDIQVSDEASVTVCEAPVVDTPDSLELPSSASITLDLDDYLVNSGNIPPAAWSADAPSGWTASFHDRDTVTIAAPGNAAGPANVTFTASVEYCTDLICSGSDVTAFIPPRLELLAASYDVISTILTLEFNKQVQIDEVNVEKIGMEYGDSGNWDSQLVANCAMTIEEGTPHENPDTEMTHYPVMINVRCVYPVTASLAIAGYLTCKDTDVLLSAGAFKDLGGLPNLEADVPLVITANGLDLRTKGDLTGDSEITAYDAALLLQFTVNGPRVLPIYDEATEICKQVTAAGQSCDIIGYLADTDSSGDISTFDVVLILEYSAGVINNLAHSSCAPPANVGTRNSYLTVKSFDAGQLEVSIGLDDVSSVYSAGIVMTYDPQTMTVTDVSRTPSVSDWMSEYAATSGELKISMAGISVPAENGSLVTVRLDMSKNAGLSLQDAIGHLKIREFSLNDGRVKATVRNLPQAFALMQNYPNPFNPETWIPYMLSEPSDVSITIYNLSGQVVRHLELGSRTPGYYIDRAGAAYWDGKNESGEQVSSGTYFYRLQAGRDAAVRKMTIVR